MTSIISAMSWLELDVVSYIFCMFNQHQSNVLSDLLLQINFENRRKGDKGDECLASVDGTDLQLRINGIGTATSSRRQV